MSSSEWGLLLDMKPTFKSIRDTCPTAPFKASPAPRSALQLSGVQPGLLVGPPPDQRGLPMGHLLSSLSSLLFCGLRICV